MPKSTYLSREILKHGFRTGSWLKVANLYVALFSADPTAAFLTANELPIGTGGYARALIAVGDAYWTAMVTSGGREVTTNVAAVNFGTATANLNGGLNIPHWGLVDAVGPGGNLWYYGPISVPRPVLVGDPITIAAGAMQIFES